MTYAPKHEKELLDGSIRRKQLLVQRFRREDLPHGKLLTRDEQISDFLAVELEVEPENLEWYLDALRDTLDIVFPFKLSAEPPSLDRYVHTDEEVAQILYLEQASKERQIVEDWEGPVGWHLEMLGKWLTDVYPWESVGDAMVFLVSGKPPRLAESLSAGINMGSATYSHYLCAVGN